MVGIDMMAELLIARRNIIRGLMGEHRVVNVFRANHKISNLRYFVSDCGGAVLLSFNDRAYYGLSYLAKYGNTGKGNTTFVGVSKGCLSHWFQLFCTKDDILDTHIYCSTYNLAGICKSQTGSVIAQAVETGIQESRQFVFKVYDQLSNEFDDLEARASSASTSWEQSGGGYL